MEKQTADFLRDIAIADKLSPKGIMVEGFVDGRTYGRSNALFNDYEMYGNRENGDGGIVKQLYERMKEEYPSREIMIITWPEEGGWQIMDPVYYSMMIPHNAAMKFSFFPRFVYNEMLKWFSSDRKAEEVSEYPVDLPSLDDLMVDASAYGLTGSERFTAVMRKADTGKGTEVWIDRLTWSQPVENLTDSALENLLIDFNDNEEIVSYIRKIADI